VGKRILVFGAGGAARAVTVELALAGASAITVANRDPARGAELVRLLNDNTAARADLLAWDTTASVPLDVDIVVNCTSIGLYPHVDGRLDLDLASLRPGLVVADVVPSPPRTHLIAAAEARGCTVLDGLGMLVNQGVISIKYWTGVDADAGVMRRTVQAIYPG
jgi:shikimate dehydrogenase